MTDLSHSRGATPAAGQLRITAIPDASVDRHTQGLTDLYSEVFAEPPHSEGPEEFERFATRWWPSQRQQPGFQLVLAEHLTDGLVGASYGYHLTPDTQWWSGALTPIEDTTEWQGRTFAIIEMMVRRPWRRRGIAQAMHTALLKAAGPAERATLLVRPDNAPARRAYEQWGYRFVGQIRPGRTSPVYDAMLRLL